MENKRNNKGNGLALIPFLVFIVVYLACGIYYQSKGVEMPFYQFPSVSALFLGLVVAILMTKGKVSDTFAVFARGTGNPDVITMLMIFLLAGAFSTVATQIGGRDAVVNLGLSVVPPQFLAAGIFVISAFMGTATGTSGGTISALTPIAASIAEAGGLNAAIAVGACVGGAMFGDNLSIISDTSIAATRGMHCEPRDKFRVNLLIALPAAVVTIICLMIWGRPDTAAANMGASAYSPIAVIPYLAVLILALVGIDVLLTLMIGIFASALIGFATSTLTVTAFGQAVWNGFCGMDESIYFSFLVCGLAEIVQHNGGIAWLTQKLRTLMKGQKSAQIGACLMVSLSDCAIANNTVAIILDSPIAREVSKEYNVDPRRMASLLDIFSCIFQCMLPYAGQVIIAVNCANNVLTKSTLSPLDISGMVWYGWALAFFGLLSIFVPFADGLTRKDPWNWEYDCPESKVVERKAELEKLAKEETEN